MSLKTEEEEKTIDYSYMWLSCMLCKTRPFHKSSSSSSLFWFSGCFVLLKDNLKTKYGEISETLADTSLASAVVGSRTASSFSGVISLSLFIGLVLPKLPVDYG